MARLAKATQTALDELDWPYAAREIEGQFMPKARVALDGIRGRLPDACFASVGRVATELAKSIGEIPTGYGSACVRHFDKRSEQLGSVFGDLSISVEHRFALIELATLASIAGRWTDPPKPRVTPASHRACLHDVAQLPATTHVAREQWRAVIVLILDSPGTTATVVRNIACALAWCGSLSPTKSVTDEQLAQQFRTGREAFVRDRLEALRWLSVLLEISIGPLAKGRAPVNEPSMHATNEPLMHAVIALAARCAERDPRPTMGAARAIAKELARTAPARQARSQGTPRSGTELRGTA